MVEKGVSCETCLNPPLPLALAWKPDWSHACALSIKARLPKRESMAIKALVVLVSVFELCVQQGVDRTLQREASGADVVRAVVRKIEGVFGRDNQFLSMRRVAFVESEDGADIDTFRSGYNGGIWQVDETAFDSTQDTNSHPMRGDRYQQIMAELGIDWLRVRWRDLRIPLDSGLAVRLFLFNIPAPIPCDACD